MSLEKEVEEVLERLKENRRVNWNKLNKRHFILVYNRYFAGLSRGHLSDDGYGGRFYLALAKRKLLDEILPPSKNKDWVSMDLKDLKRYYQTNFNGMGRGQLSENKDGRRFYAALIRRSLREDVLPPKKIIEWKDMSVNKLAQYYYAHFKGTSRSELSEESKKGRRFYAALQRRGLVDKILPRPKFINWEIMNLRDMKYYYNHNFKGMRRVDLQRDQRGVNFYAALKRKGMVDNVLPKPIIFRSKKTNSWASMTKKELRDYYRDELHSASRTELLKSKLGKSFYSGISYRGLADTVLPTKKRIEYWTSMTIKDFRNYYDKHFRGITRSQLQRNERMGRGFYNALRRLKLLDKVLPEKKYMYWGNMTTSDFKVYYNKHFRGRSRKQLRTDEKGKKFYIALLSKNLQDKVLPPRIRMEWESMKLKDLKHYYDKHFRGRSRYELQGTREGSKFYAAISRAGLVDKIVPHIYDSYGAGLGRIFEYSVLCALAVTKSRWETKKKKIKDTIHNRSSVPDLRRDSLEEVTSRGYISYADIKTTPDYGYGIFSVDEVIDRYSQNLESRRESLLEQGVKLDQDKRDRLYIYHLNGKPMQNKVVGNVDVRYEDIFNYLGTRLEKAGREDIVRFWGHLKNQLLYNETEGNKEKVVILKDRLKGILTDYRAGNTNQKFNHNYWYYAAAKSKN